MERLGYDAEVPTRSYDMAEVAGVQPYPPGSSWLPLVSMSTLEGVPPAVGTASPIATETIPALFSSNTNHVSASRPKTRRRRPGPGRSSFPGLSIIPEGNMVPVYASELQCTYGGEDIPESSEGQQRGESAHPQESGTIQFTTEPSDPQAVDEHGISTDGIPEVLRRPLVDAHGRVPGVISAQRETRRTDVVGIRDVIARMVELERRELVVQQARIEVSKKRLEFRESLLALKRAKY